MSATHGLSGELIAALVRASRLAQGLPERITDPLVLRNVSVFLGSSTVTRRGRVRRKAA